MRGQQTSTRADAAADVISVAMRIYTPPPSRHSTKNEDHSNRFDSKMTLVESVPATDVNIVLKATADTGCEGSQLLWVGQFLSGSGRIVVLGTEIWLRPGGQSPVRQHFVSVRSELRRKA